MLILPAIDLIGGKCVRLIQGEYDRQITYRDDPVEQARQFHLAGATHLHIVDLEAAKAGRPVNTDAVRAIVESVDLKVELGGGIRRQDDIQQMLDTGVERLILGTAAVKDFDWFARMTACFPGRLVLGLDARGTGVATEGWTHESGLSLVELAQRAAKLPIWGIIYTDITRDGMMAGPNLERTRALVQAVAVPVVCAGGVTVVADIVRLKETGVAGAIIGRALYEGRIDLGEALAAAS